MSFEIFVILKFLNSLYVLATSSGIGYKKLGIEVTTFWQTAANFRQQDY